MPHPRPRLRLLGALAAAGLAAGCNQYEAFRVTGFEQAGFSNDADILFIIDNSSSMWEESAELATNFDVFINELTSSTGSSTRTTLSDAVESYFRETSGQSLYIDYRLALTTSSVDYSNGAEPGIELGEAGLFTGDFIQRSDAAPADAFRTQLLCEATCWDNTDLPNDVEYVCGDPLGEEVSVEYLDCVCGTDAWKGHCGAGTEEGLEAAAMALCRTLAEPPDECFEYVNPQNPDDMLPTVLSSTDIGSNGDFLREDAMTIVVIVTDEGDGSRRVADGDTDVEPYADLWELFPNPVRFAVIGPPYEDDNGDCLGGAFPGPVERYQEMCSETGGMYIPLTDLENSCEPIAFSENLKQIGQLLSTLVTIFPLQAVPDVSSIEAWVDGKEAPRSTVIEGSETDGDAVYSDGWSYDTAYNAVHFHGTWVPDYNADVEIYYEPLGGMPRELPF